MFYRLRKKIRETLGGPTTAPPPPLVIRGLSGECEVRRFMLTQGKFRR